MPTALVLIVVGLGLASAALVATMATQRGTVRDQDHKASIGAADAGISQALFRENKIVTIPTLKCVVLGAGGFLDKGLPSADGFCPEQTSTVGRTTYSYRVKPWSLISVLEQERRQLVVVSRGSSDSISRRAAVTASAPTGVNIFGPSRAVGIDSVHLARESTTNASTGSNGTVTLDNNATLCGDVIHGPDGSFDIVSPNATQCPGFKVNEGLMNLPPPDNSGALLVNDNFRMFSLDPMDPPAPAGNASWNAATRTLNIGGSTTVTLGGGDYNFCRLVMDGSSQLIMAAGARVKIYFDDPARCGIGDGEEQISITGTASVVSSSYNGTNNFDLPGFYLVGNDEIRTKVVITGTPSAGQSNQQMVIYAPRSDVWISGTATFTGAVAGQTLYVGGTALLTSERDLPNPDVTVELLYQTDRYVECTGPNGAPPDANC